jgi:hypothetical protein
MAVCACRLFLPYRAKQILVIEGLTLALSINGCSGSFFGPPRSAGPLRNVQVSAGGLALNSDQQVSGPGLPLVSASSVGAAEAFLGIPVRWLQGWCLP